MKNRLFALLTISLLSVCISAQTSGTCGLNALWNVDNGTLTISGSGEMFDYSSASNKPWSNINITTIIIENGITSIGNHAFSNCASCTSVTIPNSVTRIGQQAFSGCRGLTNISIPNSVTIIESNAFSRCTGLISPVHNDRLFAFMPQSYQGDYGIPEGIETILYNAFKNCSYITKITIPKSIRTIEYNAFSGCDILTHVVWNAKYCEDFSFHNSTTLLNHSPFSSPITMFEFGDSVQYIPSYLCCAMVHLSSITLPQSVTSIGKCAFSNCSGLSSIIIPDNVIRIGDNAFENCSGLTTITIPQNVTNVGKKAFLNCSNIASVFWNAKNAALSYQDGTLNDSHPFYSIRDSITSFVFGDSVEIISDGMCYGMKKLQSIFIPKNVNYCGAKAFIGCSGMNSIIVDSLNSTYDSRDSCNAIIEKNNNKLILGCYTSFVPNGVTIIGERAFAGCRGLTTISIPNSVTSIESSAFYSCDLEYITIPGNVQDIESSAFHSCDSLKSICLMDGVKSIGNSAFEGCSNLLSIIIPNSITSVGRSTFSGCNGMRSISIGNSINLIDYRSFDGCTSLDTIICYNVNPPTIVSYAFNNVPTTAIIYVPAESVALYENSSTWGQLFSVFRPIEEIGTKLEDVKSKYYDSSLYDLLENPYYQIFTLQGNRVYKSSYIPAGVYIIRTDNKSNKIVIR